MVVQPPVIRSRHYKRRRVPTAGRVCLVAALSVAGILGGYLWWPKPPVLPKCHPPSSRLASTSRNPYDQLTLDLRPVGYYNVELVDSAHVIDIAGCSPAVSLLGLAGEGS